MFYLLHYIVLIYDFYLLWYLTLYLKPFPFFLQFSTFYLFSLLP
jgi:hypothetical protein